MQKIFRLLLLALLFLVSCKGEQGFPGQDGEDGINILGQVFEVEVNFTSEGEFKVLIPYPSGIEAYNGDIVMVYVLDGVVDDLDVWEPIPRTFYLTEGILLYGFNYTLVDVELFLDGTVDYNSLDSGLTQNLIFRVAIIPANLSTDVDLNSYKSVMRVVDSDLVLE